MPRGTEGSLDRLQRAEQLIYEGNFNEARPIIESLEKKDDLPPEGLLTFKLLKSKILITSGNFDDSYQLAKIVCKESLERGKLLQAVDACITIAEASEDKGNYKESIKAINQGEKLLETLTREPRNVFSLWKAFLILQKGRSCIWSGNYDQGLNYFQKCLALHQEIGNKFGIALSLMNIGAIHALKVKIDRSLEFFDKVLPIFQDIGNNYYLARCFANMGVLYGVKREFDHALKYSQKGLAIFQELGNKKQIAYCYSKIGEIFLREEELDKALEYSQKSIAQYEEIGDRSLMSTWPFGCIGLVYWLKGDLDQSLAYLEHNLIRCEENHNKIWISDTLFIMIQVSIDKGALHQAEQYLLRLQEINSQEENNLIHQRYRVAQALLLKTSNRARKKVKAEELFEEVTEEEVIEPTLTITAMLALCELLLDEIRAYGDSKALQQAKTVVKKINVLSEDSSSFSFIVEVRILQSKFEIVEGNFPAAKILLEQARLIAEEKGLTLLIKKLSVEYNQLEKDDETWKRIIQSNVPVQQRLKQAQLVEYIKTAQKLISIESTNPEWKK